MQANSSQSGAMHPHYKRAWAYIAKLPKALEGNRGHDATFEAACVLSRGFALDEETALSLLEQWNETHCEPLWSEQELRHKIRSSMFSPRPLGYLLESQAFDEPSAARSPLTSAWPKADYAEIESLVDAANEPRVFNLASLQQASPAKIDSLTSQDVLPILFPGNPLITTGLCPRHCSTDHVADVLPKAGQMQFIVPSACTAKEGKTQDGKTSQHCLSIVGPRQYLVLETDFRNEGPCGHMLTMAGLFHSMSPLDVSACVIGHLARILPTLALVTFSGGKSLHAWFNVSAFTDDDASLKRFMEIAVKLGCDHATWGKSQLCRMPGGTRAGKSPGQKCPQPIYYFNREQCLSA
jgi:hypothetical protein